MDKILAIIRKNNATFYNYRTGNRNPISRRIIITVAGSALACFMAPRFSLEMLNACLTVQAILVGFSFSVLFFLLSSRIKFDSLSASLEKKVKFEKIEKLGKELFTNVSYFSVISIGTIILAFLLLSIDFARTPSPPDILTIGTNKVIVTDMIFNLLEALLLAMLFESFYTFVRTVGRIDYYFEERLLLESD